MDVAIGWLKRIKSGSVGHSVQRLILGFASRARLGRGDRMAASVTVMVYEALRCLLLLLHHQLDHVVLVHEFLTLADSIFALHHVAVL